MAIRLKCAHCRRSIAVTSRAAGTQVPCPVCRQLLDIPTTTTAICLRERTLAPAAAPAPEVAVAAEPAKPRAIASGINYRIVGRAAAAAIGSLAVLTLVATAASRRPAPRDWEATEAFGRPMPAMALAYLDRPLFDGPAVPPDGMTEPEFHPAVAPPVDEMEVQVPAPLVINRRDQFDDEELRKLLLRVPELSLYKGQPFGKFNNSLRILPLHEVIHTVASRDDLAGLPMIPAPDCQLGKEPAESLQTVSTNLRTKMFTAGQRRGRGTVPNDPTDAVAELLQEQRRYIKVGDRMKETGFREASIPTVMQMLCVENRSVRQLVVDHLGQISDKRSTKALAKIALFDLSAKVRAEALQVLAERPRGEYRQALLDGLRYPWAPVADHAAEALVVLEDRDAIPALKELAKLPDPSAPTYDPQQKKHFTREVVRINHLGNCMLCHAPSKATTDLVRGRIATPGEALPPPVQYYAGQDGIFVRADITYLKQDFSVVQPVDNHGAWPSMQRFDYLVRNRPLSEEQAMELSRLARNYYPQREAVEHAILQLASLPVKPRQNDEVTLEK